MKLEDGTEIVKGYFEGKTNNPYVNTSCSPPCSMRKWQLTCKNCKATEKWYASSYEEASDKIVTMGWSSDRFIGGMVCPKCRVA